MASSAGCGFLRYAFGDSSGPSGAYNDFGMMESIKTNGSTQQADTTGSSRTSHASTSITVGGDVEVQVSYVAYNDAAYNQQRLRSWYFGELANRGDPKLWLEQILPDGVVAARGYFVISEYSLNSTEKDAFKGSFTAKLQGDADFYTEPY